MSKNIVTFPGAEPLPSNLLERAEDSQRRAGNYCTHGRITLDAHNRLVICVECGATLDPFDFLLQQADLLRRAWDNYRIASRRAADLGESISTLLAEEKRVKARLRRAKDAQPAIDTRGRDKR